MKSRLHPGFLLVIHSESEARRVLNVVELLTRVARTLCAAVGCEGHSFALAMLGQSKVQISESRTDVK